MFTPTHHHYLRTVRIFSPQGFSPYDPALVKDDGQGVLILPAGGRVAVESAWFRNAMPDDDMILLYVRSEDTGLATHVPAYDLLPLSRA